MSKDSLLSVLQYNVRKSKDGVMAPLLEEQEIQDYDILAIQEPSYNSFNKSTYNPSSSKFLLAHESGPDVRTCFYINKRMDPASWEVRYRGGDFCSLRLNIKQGGREEGGSGTPSPPAQELILWVHNVYNQSPTSPEVATASPVLISLEQALEEEGEHIALGDFNLHHPRWNNKGRYTYHKMADRLIEVTQAKEMTLGLPDDSVTWKSRGQESAIDLVFLTPRAHQAMVRCTPREDLGHASDHVPVATELE